MKYTKINITNNTVIEAYGTHTKRNSKGVYVVEMKMAFVSMTDAAEAIGCSVDSVSNVIRGKQRTANGYHIIEVSKMGEAFPQLMAYQSNIPTPRAKANMEVSREELAEFRKRKAEKEARRKAEEKARKAEERKAKKLHKAEMAVLKYEKKCKAADGNLTKYQAILDKNSAKLLVAQEKLRLLKGGDVE
jgi:plasmid maintenance system antidote protein VapI